MAPEKTPSRRALRLADADLHQKFRSRQQYEKRLARVQLRLLAVQQAYLTQGRRAIIVFEGWDAAGKGGAIRRLAERLDPRSLKVWPIGTPSADEEGRHHLYRFWQRLPGPGQIAVFDRSWYGRVLIERVEGYVPAPVWRRGYREINAFERLLVDDGVRLVKLFLHVSAAEQRRRLLERIEVPYKRWKIGPDDVRNLTLREAYGRAVDDMLMRTSPLRAPWRLIAAEHKWHARVEALEVVAESLARNVDLSPPSIPAELRSAIDLAAPPAAARARLSASSGC